MALNLPYGQHHYMGEYANDALALIFIQANCWDSLSNGTGTPRDGMTYYNTALDKLKRYCNGAWVVPPWNEEVEQDHFSTGLLTGGELTDGGGIVVNIAAGSGYVNYGSYINKKITWGPLTATMIYVGTNYIGINPNGSVRITNIPFSSSDYIPLGYAFTINSLTDLGTIANTPIRVANFEWNLANFLLTGIGILVEYGNLVSETPGTPLNLTITGGHLKVILEDVPVGDTTVFVKWYNSSDLGWIQCTDDPNLVETSKWNDITHPAATAEVEMTLGWWAKALVLRTLDGVVHYVYSQAEYVTETLAKEAFIPAPPEIISATGAYLATIVYQKGDISVANRIYDVRPNFARIFGFGTSGTVGTVINHSSLLGLGADDHSQYHNDARGDLRYFQQSVFVDVSSGVGDAGKPVKLNAGGTVDDTMLSTYVMTHSNLFGLSADDHLQYHTDGRGDARYYQQTGFVAITGGLPDAGKPVKLNASGFIDDTMRPLRTHASCTGLDHDDHLQYHTDARGDARYYQKIEFVNTSMGVTDAGKPVKLNAGGLIDDSMISVYVMTHGSLFGLSADDHLQYLTNARGDARYPLLTSFISITTGASDAGKPIKTNSAGLLDDSMLSTFVMTHGSLFGLSADDHTQYHTNARGDARYYTQASFIAVSTGAPDAGKPIKADSGGKLDGSFVNAAGISHSTLSGLAADDHTQYHNDTRGDARYYQKTEFINTSTGAPDAGKPIKANASGRLAATFIVQTDIDHGSISGLADDDHTQYHNDTRGDIRYYQKTEFINASTGAPDAGKPIVLNASGKFAASFYLQTDVDHGSISGLADDDHTQYLNNTRGDARYSQLTSFISVSTGALDAGKPIKTNSSGQVDISFINQGAITHANLANLSADDHTQYLNNTRGDARYYTQSSFLGASAGIGSAGRPVKLNASGLVDNTMLTGYLPNSGYAESETDSTNATTSYVQKVRLTFTPAATGFYLVQWSAGISNSTTNRYGGVRCRQDSTTDLGENQFRIAASGLFQNFAGIKRIQFTDTAAHTFDIDFVSENAANTVTIRRARIWIMRTN